MSLKPNEKPKLFGDQSDKQKLAIIVKICEYRQQESH